MVLVLEKSFLTNIRDFRQQRPVSLSRCCQLFGISRQAIYQEKIRLERRVQELALIKPMVSALSRKMPRLGTCKLYYLLKEDFKKAEIKIGRDGLFNYLRSEHMLIQPVKSYTKTTYSKHWLKKHPNLMKAVTVKRPEEYFISDNMSAENVVKALNMAIKQRRTSFPLVHHSDRGLQYCSAIYRTQLTNNNIQPTMTDGYDCYQNAMAERINGRLKQEFLIHTCNTRKELELLAKESIHTYNNERPHLNLNMKTPNFIHQKTCEEYSTG